MSKGSKRRVLLIACAAALWAGPASAATICGWFVNPTPGNFWLTDAEGEWILSFQGQAPPPGFDNIPDMSTGGWVETNGYYGYGCGCVTGDVDRKSKRFTRIRSAKPRSLEWCRTDKRLPAYE